MIGCVIVDEKHTKEVKKHLEKSDLLHKDFRITKLNNGIAVPFTFKKKLYDGENIDNHLHEILPNDLNYVIEYLNENDLQPQKFIAHADELIQFISSYFNTNPTNVTINTILSDIPSKWDIHNDLVMFPDTSFTLEIWESLPQSFWTGIADIMRVKRIAVKSRIKNDNFRTPKMKLVLGDDVIVKHIDNGVCYEFDITKNMFSKGNISEKLRIAKFDCTNEVVVDMFAGIGYFVLPYLLKANAKKVYAVEWNPDAVSALYRNLEINHVTKERCEVLYGDNRKVTPKNIADRVNLGLIPTSSASWGVACECLNQSKGGWLHIHENVESKLSTLLHEQTKYLNEEDIELNNQDTKLNEQEIELNNQELKCKCEKMCVINQIFKGKINENKRIAWCRFVDTLECKLRCYFKKVWKVNVENIEYLKSYAPHVDNLIFDVKCTPIDN